MVERIRGDAPVLVIGLGRFGAACAGELDRLNREVLAIDDNLELVQNFRVCPKCDHHMTQSAHERLEMLLDVGSFEEHDANMV